MEASGKHIKFLNGQLFFLISWSIPALRHICLSPWKGCPMEGRLPPCISDLPESSDRVHKEQIWPKSCLLESEQGSVYPGNSAETEEGRLEPVPWGPWVFSQQSHYPSNACKIQVPKPTQNCRTGRWLWKTVSVWEGNGNFFLQSD